MKELPINQIVCGDALEVMKSWPTESIDMCMTSPPYYGLRDYGVEQVFGGDKNCEHEWGNCAKSSQRLRDPKTVVPELLNPQMGNICLKCRGWHGQLGLEPTVEMYIEHLAEIFNEVKRVLKKEGTFWLNIGDTYGGSCQGGGDTGLSKERYRKELLTYTDKPQRKLMPKCLLMIPERLAWSLIQNGWIFRNKIVWFKPNAMPSSVKDRFSNKWEYLFLFVKSDKPVYWTNKKTLQLVTKKPLGIKGKEGMDWEWREVGLNYSNSNTKIKKENSEKLSSSRARVYREKKLKKVSLWTAHGYYFDLDAVREPHLPQSITRAQGHDYTDGPWAVPGGVDGEHGRLHELGKNPGDVLEIGAETRTMGAIIGSGGGVKVPGGKGWTGHPEGGGAACKKDPRWQPPMGKNPGDFWSINTQPFPEAHFAVFPEKLCIKPIKAGCPEEVCKKCGKARERITEKGDLIESREPEHGLRAKMKNDKYIGNAGLRDGFELREIKTIDWTSCDCKARFEGGVVLDPFCGAGTVLFVAKEMRRRYIGIDVKQEYCEMAEKRMAQGVLPLT